MLAACGPPSAQEGMSHLPCWRYDRHMARWSVYMVRCRDGSLYTGISTDVAARVEAHNSGRGARYTRARRPVTLVLWRACGNERVARRLEAALKKLPPAAKRALVAGETHKALVGLRRRLAGAQRV
jgi:putative endonuclease